MSRVLTSNLSRDSNNDTKSWGTFLRQYVYRVGRYLTLALLPSTLRHPASKSSTFALSARRLLRTHRTSNGRGTSMLEPSDRVGQTHFIASHECAKRMRTVAPSTQQYQLTACGSEKARETPTQADRCPQRAHSGKGVTPRPDSQRAHDIPETAWVTSGRNRHNNM